MNSETLFQNFSEYFASQVKNVKSYKQDPIIPFELIIKYHSGHIYVYNDLQRSIKSIHASSEKMTMEEWTKEYGRRLRTRMSLMGYEQQGLAKRVGISQGAISSYVTGRRSPDFFVASGIAEVLGCTLADMNCDYSDL